MTESEWRAPDLTELKRRVKTVHREIGNTKYVQKLFRGLPARARKIYENGGQ